MRVDISMTSEENKFTAERWWATSPAFVLFTLERQLEAAKAIWPELESYRVGSPSEIARPGDDYTARLIAQRLSY